MKSERINRLANLLNPRSPSSTIHSTAGLLGIFADADAHENGYRESLVSDALEVNLDFESAKPLTDEDYILDCDIENHSDTQFLARHLLEIKECRVLSSDGDIITRQGQLLEALTPQNFGKNYHNVLLKRRFSKSINLPGNTFNLAKPFTTNYYHWLLEALPILDYVDRGEFEINNYLVAKKTAFVMKSLIQHGVPESSIIELDNNEYKCDRLFSTSVQTSILPNPIDVQWLRSKFLVSPPTGLRKIYISRNDTQSREVENEAEVYALLNQYDFEILELSKLTFEDQISYFSEAECVISSHGAGLANLVFCSSKTKVLEIFPARWTPLCFMGLAQYIEADYFYCNADSLGLTQDQIHSNRGFLPVDSASQTESISIPMDKLALFCEQYL